MRTWNCNIGSATLKRLDYTVIGDTANTATGSGQEVINEACYQKIKQSFNCAPIGAATLKNKAAEMMLYEVLS